MINHLNKMKLVFYLIVPAVFCVCGSVCGQDSAITDTTNIQEYDVIELVPEAIPVLTPTEAQAANEEALKEYDTWMADTRKQKNIQLIKSIVKSVILLLIVLFALKFILKICEKKGIRSHLKKIYKSPFCKVLYDTRFCRLDWIAMLLIFVVTFFSSLLIGQKAMLY